MLSHEKAIILISWYLIDTCSHGIVYKPNTTKGLECYVNADFASGWSHANADKAEDVLSRTGYIITYAGCPFHWVSCLQTEVALSAAEAEYIALSQSLHDVLPLKSLLEELHNIFPLKVIPSDFICKVHEDN